jgi:hypothetical protein
MDEIPLLGGGCKRVGVHPPPSRGTSSDAQSSKIGTQALTTASMPTPQSTPASGIPVLVESHDASARHRTSELRIRVTFIKSYLKNEGGLSGSFDGL